MSVTSHPLEQPGTVLLDTALADRENQQSLLFTKPQRIVTAEALDEVPDVLHALDDAVAEGAYVAGFLAYEAGYAFETIAPLPRGTGPLAWFGVYHRPTVLDEAGVTTRLDAYRDAACRVEEEHLVIGREAYRRRIAAIKASIRAGDVYQVNFTDRVAFAFTGAAPALFRALRRHQRVPYAAYINTGASQILSLSPELFFRREGPRITTRPMKGTVRRGSTAEEDEALQRWLAADEKSRAENLMIVDLLRNDLSRVCVPGSVQVPHLFAVEPYATLSQMTSTVEGRLRPEATYAGILRALFPCGSVTGAPKIRAMQRIAALEATPRGVYCGAIGFIAPDRQAAFNVAIRTVVLEDGRGVLGTGSGIVWDSDADAEFDECRLKAQFLSGLDAVEMGDFQLIETMRAEGGRVALLDLHIERMQASARQLGFPFDEAAFRAQVQQAIDGRDGQPTRLRLTLDRAGAFHTTTHALTVTPLRRITCAGERVRSDDVFVHHKTTRRALYERAYRQARHDGFDEVLFLNERGEVTEGSRSNVYVERDGLLTTPPLSSGVLNGVYRRHLLRTREDVVEGVLYPDDVLQADAVYLSNAVWGLRRVEKMVGIVPASVSSDS